MSERDNDNRYLIRAEASEEQKVALWGRELFRLPAELLEECGWYTDRVTPMTTGKSHTIAPAPRPGEVFITPSDPWDQRELEDVMSELGMLHKKRELAAAKIAMWRERRDDAEHPPSARERATLEYRIRMWMSPSLPKIYIGLHARLRQILFRSKMELNARVLEELRIVDTRNVPTWDQLRDRGVMGGLDRR